MRYPLVPLILSLALAAPLIARSAPKSRPDRASSATVMTVFNHPVTAAEFGAALATLPPPQRNGYELHPEHAAAWYGRLEALGQEALREHLDAGLDGGLDGSLDEGQDRVRYLNALSGRLIEKVAHESAPSETAVRAYYTAHHSAFEQVRVRHLLVATRGGLGAPAVRSEAAARQAVQELMKQLHSGADFAALARQHSDDAATRAAGGEMGWVARHQLAPSVDAALFRLPAGAISQPLATFAGIEIFQVEQRRQQPLDAVRAQIVGTLKAASVERRLAAIVVAAHVTFMGKPLPCN